VKRNAGRRKVLKCAIAASFAALLLFVGPAEGLRVEAGNLILDNEADFSPRRLPRLQNAPISLRQSFTISSAEGGPPATLETITYRFDRHGAVDVVGLPVCTNGMLNGTDTSAARRACRPAIIGTGVATAVIAFPEQAPFRTSAPITLFNGPKANGRPTVLAHAFASLPSPTTFIVPVVVEKARLGEYGYRVEARIPQIAGGAGHLIALSFTIGRKWHYKHSSRSYVNARCETGHLKAQAEFAFQTGDFLTGSVLRPCAPL
jgi:hypothetical protein